MEDVAGNEIHIFHLHEVSDCVERGNFWGMGYVSSVQQITSAAELKNYLQPYADNDTIRNSIYSFVEMNPGKKMALSIY